MAVTLGLSKCVSSDELNNILIAHIPFHSVPKEITLELRKVPEWLKTDRYGDFEINDISKYFVWIGSEGITRLIHFKDIAGIVIDMDESHQPRPTSTTQKNKSIKRQEVTTPNWVRNKHRDRRIHRKTRKPDIYKYATIIGGT